MSLMDDAIQAYAKDQLENKEADEKEKKREEKNENMIIETK